MTTIEKIFATTDSKIMSIQFHSIKLQPNPIWSLLNDWESLMHVCSIHRRCQSNEKSSINRKFNTKKRFSIFFNFRFYFSFVNELRWDRDVYNSIVRSMNVVLFRFHLKFDRNRKRRWICSSRRKKRTF